MLRRIALQMQCASNCQSVGKVPGREMLQGSDWLPEPLPSQNEGLCWLCMGLVVIVQTNFHVDPQLHMV